MSKADHHQADELVAAVAAAAEAAYRRGFQQGHDAAARGDRLAFDIVRWRFVVPLDTSPGIIDGRTMPATDRLRMHARDTVGEIEDAVRGQ